MKTVTFLIGFLILVWMAIVTLKISNLEQNKLECPRNGAIYVRDFNFQGLYDENGPIKTISLLTYVSLSKDPRKQW